MLERSGIVKSFFSPLKEKFKYYGAVTLCIAATCQEQGHPRIVLCSDTRLDYADLGSTNTTCKLDVLGHGWCVQLAGEWGGVSYFCSLIREGVQDSPGPFASIRDIESQAKRATATFLKSSLCKTDQVYQLLLSGFLDKRPVLFTVSIFERNPKVELSDSFAVIGYGYTIASTVLKLREYHSGMPLSYASYLVYEAKRCSEKTGSVGHITALAIQAPGDVDVRDKAYVKIMNELGKANLESLYRGIWKVPFVEIPDLPAEFFVG